MKNVALNAPTITPYTKRDRHLVHDLIFRSYRAHTHLDWQETDQWLETDGLSVRLAWQYGKLIGVLGASVPMEGTCWMRLAAISDSADAAPVFALLWESLSAELRERGVHTVALLMLRDWLTPLITPLGFRYVEEIVTLRRADQPLPPPTTPGEWSLRQARPEDIPAVAQVDQAAFKAPWQMTLAEVRQAARVSAYCTVAVRCDQILGYQLSTMYFDGAHLARLAVDPAAQGMGIAASLVADLIRRFARRSVFTVTVNTQSSNTRSQQLYERFGFRRNCYDLPVWMVRL